MSFYLATGKGRPARVPAAADAHGIRR
jgi:hypothetical protein